MLFSIFDISYQNSRHYSRWAFEILNPGFDHCWAKINDLGEDTSEKSMLSNANTKPIGGKDLKILDIIRSLENPRLCLGFFQTTHDIENFKIFTTNGFSIVSIFATIRKCSKAFRT